MKGRPSGMSGYSWYSWYLAQGPAQLQQMLNEPVSISPLANTKLPLSAPQDLGGGADRSRDTSHPSHTSGLPFSCHLCLKSSIRAWSCQRLSQKHPWEKTGRQESQVKRESTGPNHCSATEQLIALGQVTQRLCASVSPPVQWGD